jgi:hypothetical protein
MSRAPALTVWQQISLDLFVPPVITFAWWLISRARTRGLNQDEEITVEGWIEDGWKYLLGALYLIMIAETVYAYFTR